jgi:hypothetical protein
MAKRSVVRLDSLKAVYNDASVHSVRVSEEFENGWVGHIGDVEAGNADVKALVKPKTGTEDQSVVVVANPALVYDNGRMGSGFEINYFMEAGEAVRAYELTPNDILSVSKEGVQLLAADAVAGNYLVTDTTASGSHKLKEIAAADYDLLATKPKFAAKIVRQDTVGGALAVNVTQSPTVYVVAQVVSN